jgi:hypothetical protein
MFSSLKRERTFCYISVVLWLSIPFHSMYNYVIILEVFFGLKMGLKHKKGTQKILSA